jgi:hypothetical protein
LNVLEGILHAGFIELLFGDRQLSVPALIGGIG